MQALEYTFLGHASCLFAAGDIAVLTDPVLCPRLWWQQRRAEAAIQPDTLPELSAILLSHLHPDHLNIASFRYLRSTIPVVIPVGCAAAVHRFIKHPVIELAHWVPLLIAPGLTITAVPVRHPGGRWIPGLHQPNNNAYLIDMAGKRLYFAGDTAFGTHFREVGDLGAVDLACLPIQHWLPRWMPGIAPLTATQWLQAAQDVKATTATPTHWGSFGNPHRDAHALERLKQAAVDRHQLEQLRIITPNTAQTFV